MLDAAGASGSKRLDENLSDDDNDDVEIFSSAASGTFFFWENKSTEVPDDLWRETLGYK